MPAHFPILHPVAAARSFRLTSRNIANALSTFALEIEKSSRFSVQRKRADQSSVTKEFHRRASEDLRKKGIREEGPRLNWLRV